MLNISVNFRFFLFIQIENHFLKAICSYVFIKKKCIFFTTFYCILLCVPQITVLSGKSQFQSNCILNVFRCNGVRKMKERGSKAAGNILTKKKWKMGSDSFERSINSIDIKYCISSYSFRGNYSFLNLEIVANSNSCYNISIFYLIN